MLVWQQPTHLRLLHYLEKAKHRENIESTLTQLRRELPELTVADVQSHQSTSRKLLEQSDTWKSMLQYNMSHAILEGFKQVESKYTPDQPWIATFFGFGVSTPTIVFCEFIHIVEPYHSFRLLRTLHPPTRDEWALNFVVLVHKPSLNGVSSCTSPADALARLRKYHPKPESLQSIVDAATTLLSV
jgi:hypothetical protein